jgi:hypothetical protein
VTINDNEASTNMVELEKNAYTVGENAGEVIIKVCHVSNTNLDGFSVNYYTSDVTAKAGADYTTLSGTLNFAAGESEKTISINILNDGIYEGNETFMVVLKDPANGVTIGTNAAVAITINDDEQPGVFSFDKSSYRVNENAPNGEVSIDIKRTGFTGNSASVFVECHPVNTTAALKEDFSYPSGTSGYIEFGIGESSKAMTFLIINDALVEGNEYISLYLTAPTGGTIDEANRTTDILIIDDETVVLPPTVILKDNNTQWPAIEVSGINYGEKITLYQLDTSTQTKEKKWGPEIIGGNSYSISNISSYGSGTYYVTRTVNDVESDYSLPVSVTVTSSQIENIPGLTQSVNVTPGTNSGTIKLTITGRNESAYYFYGVGDIARQGQVPGNTVFGSESGFAPNQLSQDETDNINASVGQYLNCYEVAGSGYGDKITAVTSVQITAKMITSL